MGADKAVLPAHGPQGLLFRCISPFGIKLSVCVVGVGLPLRFHARRSSFCLPLFDALSSFFSIDWDNVARGVTIRGIAVFP